MRDGRLSAQHDQHSINTPTGPPNAGIPNPTVKRVMVRRLSCRTFNNDRMGARRDTTLRNIPVYTGLYGRLPDGYPIFHPVLTGGSLALCAEVSSIRHTFGRRRPTMRLRTLIIPGFEPRAPLPGNRHGGSTPGWYGMMTVVYPGVYRGVYIPGWCIYHGR